MTEEEAKTKWCPMVRVGLHGVNTTVGTNVADCAAVHCIGSACMMWRAETSARYTVPFPDDPTPQIAHVKHVSIGGYCGLAGKP